MRQTTPNGMLYLNSGAVRMSDVTDGASNTVNAWRFAIRLLGQMGFSCCVRVWDDSGRRSSRSMWDTYWHWRSDLRLVHPFFSFSSAHTGNLACFALADGSTKTVSKTVDKNVFKAVSRNGALRGMASSPVVVNPENVDGLAGDLRKVLDTWP